MRQFIISLSAIFLIISTTNAYSNDASLIYKFIKESNAPQVRIELSKGVSFNDLYNGGTAIHWAAKSNSTEIIDMLVNIGADMNAKGEDGETPLHWALFNGSVEAAMHLMEIGADRDNLNDKGNSLIHVASSSPDIMEYFIKSNMDVNVKNKLGRTPLHLASFTGNVEAIRMLVSAGADINAKDNFGQTPLFNVVNLSSSNVLQSMDLLLKSGALANIKDIYGYKPIDYAISNGDEQYAEMLRLYN